MIVHVRFIGFSCGLTSDSVIFEYHARTGVIRTFMGRKGSSAFHSEPNLPEGKLQGQARWGSSVVRSKSELPLTAFPLLFPNQTGHGGKEFRTRVKVGNLRITGVLYQRQAQITIRC
jgi:hypothetical protein